MNWTGEDAGGTELARASGADRDRNYSVVRTINMFYSRNSTLMVALIILTQMPVPGLISQAQSAESNRPYPAMAPLDQYLIADRNSEIALAKTAAPNSISDLAEVLVLGHDGYTSAVQGRNGFVCLVERSWASATDDPEFWNPKIRSPQCVNAPAARTYLPSVLMKTKLAVAGRSQAQIAQAVSSAYDRQELPALEPGAMSYMMSRQQYLNDGGKAWHPHLMWFVRGDVADAWGANLPGSPVIATIDSENRMTVFMVRVGQWSDGTSVPQHAHAM
jgi:hypothetical protein